MTLDRLGLEHQTVLGLPPVEFVHLAADLGCRYVAVAPSGGPYNPHGYEPYSLRSALRARQRKGQPSQRGGDVTDNDTAFTGRYGFRFGQGYFDRQETRQDSCP
jgi:hypothetical protein